MKITEIDSKTWEKESAETTMYVGLEESPWGLLLVGVIGGALAHLTFWEMEAVSEEATTDYLRKRWGNAVKIAYSGKICAEYAKKVILCVTNEDNRELDLFLKGTEFQRSIWKELLKIGRGESMEYGEIAERIGRVKAVRAVGSAVGRNPISLYVPCHRVLPRSGGVGGYAWGPEIKRVLLKKEGIELGEVKGGKASFH